MPRNPTAPHTATIHASCFASIGDSETDLPQQLAGAFGAHQVQDEVAAVAAAASEWMSQHAPPGHAPSNDSPPSDYKGLCRLCLVPIELVQLPTLQLQPDVECLVSLMVTAMQRLQVSLFSSSICSVRPAYALCSGQMLAKCYMGIEHPVACVHMFCNASDVLL